MRASGWDAERDLAPAAWWRWYKSELQFPQRALVTAVVAANFVLVATYLAGFFVGGAGYDWVVFVQASERVATGDLYMREGLAGWQYSPLLASAFTIVAPLGFLGWATLHVAALTLLRDRWLTLMALASFPFWADVYNGNTMTFVFVAAVTALRGSTIGSGVSLLLFMLMPRPLMLPLVAWIIWHQPRWRVGFLVLLVANAVLVYSTGYAFEWAETLLGVGDAVAASTRDVGPGAIIGPWWPALGAVLAIVLVIRGRVGWASLAAAPYWLPQYLIMLLLELVTVPRRSELGIRHNLPREPR